MEPPFNVPIEKSNTILGALVAVEIETAIFRARSARNQHTTTIPRLALEHENDVHKERQLSMLSWNAQDKLCEVSYRIKELPPQETMWNDQQE